MIKCLSCAAQIAPQLVCPRCGAPLPHDLDCFAALGIPRNLTIDPEQLETAYHELSRKVHPDRFATKSAALRDSSLRATALLTRAYRTLRDPVGRGLYWLELNGHKLSANNNRVPPDLAELVFEVQEQLEELSRDPSCESRRGIESRRLALQSALNDANARLAENFGKWNVAQLSRKALTDELKSTLSRIAYLRTLIRDVDRGLEETGLSPEPRRSPNSDGS
jgi:molecular chaperone HscB